MIRMASIASSGGSGRLVRLTSIASSGESGRLVRKTSVNSSGESGRLVRMASITSTSEAGRGGSLGSNMAEGSVCEVVPEGDAFQRSVSEREVPGSIPFAIWAVQQMREKNVSSRRMSFDGAPPTVPATPLSEFGSTFIARETYRRSNSNKSLSTDGNSLPQSSTGSIRLFSENSLGDLPDWIPPAVAQLITSTPASSQAEVSENVPPLPFEAAWRPPGVPVPGAASHLAGPPGVAGPAVAPSGEWGDVQSAAGQVGPAGVLPVVSPLPYPSQGADPFAAVFPTTGVQVMHVEDDVDDQDFDDFLQAEPQARPQAPPFPFGGVGHFASIFVDIGGYDTECRSATLAWGWEG